MGRIKAAELLSKNDKDHESRAIDITRERLDLLNRKLKQKIVLGINDLKNEVGEARGTKVTISIPVLSYLV